MPAVVSAYAVRLAFVGGATRLSRVGSTAQSSSATGTGRGFKENHPSQWGKRNQESTEPCLASTAGRESWLDTLSLVSINRIASRRSADYGSTDGYGAGMDTFGVLCPENP